MYISSTKEVLLVFALVTVAAAIVPNKDCPINGPRSSTSKLIYNHLYTSNQFRIMESSKLDAFTRSDAVYGTVNGHDIPLSVWMPKDAEPGAHPVMVRWHGGALMNGARNYELWWPAWYVLQFF